MKLTMSALAVFAIVVTTETAFAGDFGSSSAGEKLANRNCSWCHGPSGEGLSTAPRLAGQTRQYIENQLVDFRHHSRDNPKSQAYMWGAAERVGPEAAYELAVYFSSLTPEAASDGDRNLIAAGQAIYKDGNQSANIPSCVACHGPNAEGVGAMPRLGGLSQRYLKRRLLQWGEGYHATAKTPMAEIAKNLPPYEIDALASYLSFVK